MDKLKSLLMQALQLAKLQESVSRNTVIAKEIAATINKNFKSKATMQEVTAILKGSQPAAMTQDSRPKTMKVWGGPSMTKKNLNKPSTQEKVVVDNTANEDNDNSTAPNNLTNPPSNEEILDDGFDPAKIGEMTPQAIIDHFGTMDKVREASKNMGFTIDPAMDPMDFVTEFQEAVLLSSMDEETPEPVKAKKKIAKKKTKAKE